MSTNEQTTESAPFGIPDPPANAPEDCGAYCGACHRCVDEQRHAAAYYELYGEEG